MDTYTDIPRVVLRAQPSHSLLQQHRNSLQHEHLDSLHSDRTSKRKRINISKYSLWTDYALESLFCLKCFLVLLKKEIFPKNLLSAEIFKICEKVSARPILMTVVGLDGGKIGNLGSVGGWRIAVCTRRVSLGLL